LSSSHILTEYVRKIRGVQLAVVGLALLLRVPNKFKTMPFGQFASTAQFYLYGTRQCTQTGWKAASDVYPQPDILQTDLSLEDKVYIVTGANGGIGFEITSNLAKRKATVYMICRSRERAEKAREQIVTTTANPNVHVIIADCARQRDVRYAWEEFVQHRLSLSESPQLHGLLCNAGGLSNDLTVTDEGIETTFAAHLLFGTYLLTKLALQTLEATPDSRVVVVSSGGMYNTKWPAWEIGTSQSGTYDGQLAYAYAKRGQVLLCEQWTQMFATSGVKFVTSHPGWVDTDGVTAAYGEKKKYLEPMRNLWEGSEGIIWLLVVDRREIEGGAFYLDRTPRVKHMAGPFFTEGSFTKNTPEEVKSLMTGLEIWSELQGPPEPFPTGPLVAMQAPIDIPRYMGKWCIFLTHLLSINLTIPIFK
jgi:dehydrogenase/reductase SDR family member 12